MKFVKIISGAILTAWLVFPAFPQSVECAAKIVDLKGEAEIRTTGEEGWASAEVELILNEGDVLRTKAGSGVVLELAAGGEEIATVEIEENSQLVIAEFTRDEDEGIQNVLLDLAVGRMLIKVQKLYSEKSKFQVKTPTSIVDVRKTIFVVEVESVE
ncbi:MAG: FecR family protein [Candidatus Omnitrophica bacterium]|nr:FecR family protein [Candidatus Omnitrophota bacterium]MBU1783764.1 FecR family protein [Candidatus Omnitrophota bacterium]